MRSLHPIVLAASKGELPDWAVYREDRYRHMERVARLMKTWAEARGLRPRKVKRWIAAGFLHDALRNEKSSRLRLVVPPRFKRLAGPVLHGPAAAQKLRHEGVEDEKLLLAIEYHTLGSRHLSTLGRALYAADFLEPGRVRRVKWRSKLRKRMPDELEAVVLEILAARLEHQLHSSRPVRLETVGMWNAMTRGKRWAAASEV
jgi:HD superfamily phosphohydrolase YqeK